VACHWDFLIIIGKRLSFDEKPECANPFKAFDSIGNIVKTELKKTA